MFDVAYSVVFTRRLREDMRQERDLTSVPRRVLYRTLYVQPPHCQVSCTKHGGRRTGSTACAILVRTDYAGARVLQEQSRWCLECRALINIASYVVREHSRFEAVHIISMNVQQYRYVYCYKLHTSSIAQTTTCIYISVIHVLQKAVCDITRGSHRLLSTKIYF